MPPGDIGDPNTGDPKIVQQIKDGDDPCNGDVEPVEFEVVWVVNYGSGGCEFECEILFHENLNKACEMQVPCDGEVLKTEWRGYFAGCTIATCL